MLDSLGPQVRKKSLSTLCKICGRQAFLPRSLQIPLCYDRLKEAQYSGGYADVWMGEHRGRKVAVKVLRINMRSNLDKMTAVGRSLNFPMVHIKVFTADYVEVLQGSDDVEKSPPPKRAPTARRHNAQQAFCNGVGMDGQREYKSVHSGKPKCGPV